ncbi:uncharacterized protein LOC134776825 [Penaeus indicus]|uniref:uncharacterized protein LOC134776825 n=1 Tax=Penaeus indicus TaxID=29960 RepID=UPI00300C11DC
MRKPTKPSVTKAVTKKTLRGHPPGRALPRLRIIRIYSNSDFHPLNSNSGLSTRPSEHLWRARAGARLIVSVDKSRNDAGLSVLCPEAFTLRPHTHPSNALPQATALGLPPSRPPAQRKPKEQQPLWAFGRPSRAAKQGGQAGHRTPVRPSPKSEVTVLLLDARAGARAPRGSSASADTKARRTFSWTLEGASIRTSAPPPHDARLTTPPRSSASAPPSAPRPSPPSAWYPVPRRYSPRILGLSVVERVPASSSASRSALAASECPTPDTRRPMPDARRPPTPAMMPSTAMPSIF